VARPPEWKASVNRTLVPARIRFQYVCRAERAIPVSMRVSSSVSAQADPKATNRPSAIADVAP
jgi:hypothetical protein